MSELSYSLHLSSDKNRKPSSKNMAKNNTSGSTSLSNNAIQNAKQLSRVDKHNYRKYDNNSELIEIIKGTTSLYEDVKNLYLEEFEEARLEYNKEQENKGRNDRKITDYFKKISDNTKNDLACEIIIELGDKKYWDTKDDKFKHKMTNVFKEQLNDLQELVPDFKIASAIIHYDETSPHLHVVGVPIKYKSKNGMSKQVGKGDVFTRDSLRTIQDKMRTLCIASFNKEYGLNNILKKKEKGRNKDINVKDMTNYQAMKEELNKNKEALEIASKKSSELDKTTNDIKDTINNLKKAPIVKNTYTISESDRNKIIDYVDKVQDTNKDFKKTEMLSVTLNNVDTELQENREKIKILTENNKALTLKVDTLSKNIDNKNKEIKELKNDNKHLQEMVDYFKNLFRRLVKFIKNKMFGKEKEREDYWKVSKDMYEHGIFSDETIESIKDDYVWNKENDKHKDKGRDDFEL
ncbi:MAG: plasmid recombination protein [Bacilli bacterium]|jgi:regulator of replication initiation timing|nr:plasmid recombination protein [Bacilli bacterium]MBR4004117.1 plasmid recombination protein [Clostridia bacterium]MCI6190757.1 plasmid recombination protein [Clostridium sp.]MCI6615105.1 plasmid recombination protein [Mollicutes bacterium]MCI6899605.1 plasmid recombination protein [Mycoplasmatota bacterium]MDD6941143.1 plasmid recombination protein [bacterium]MDY3778118.1 plasmid recombination protein [Candidatus Onthovivens sp.]